MFGGANVVIIVGLPPSMTPVNVSTDPLLTLYCYRRNNTLSICDLLG